MKILLTNDDGVNAPGLKIVYEKLAGKHEMFVCAPSKQMSAMSHSIHLFKELEYHKLDDKVYAVDGSPADCVKIGLFGVFKHVDFDLIISGINDGPNMGDDVFYSGTVGAAREAVLNGIFAIACSFGAWSYDIDYQAGAEYIEKLVDMLTPEMLRMKVFLNVNFPDLKQFNGVKITKLGIGHRIYRDFIRFSEKDGKHYAVIGGDSPDFALSDGTDLDAVSKGYISITPLSNMVYDRGLIRKFKKCERILSSQTK